MILFPLLLSRRGYRLAWSMRMRAFADTLHFCNRDRREEPDEEQEEQEEHAKAAERPSPVVPGRDVILPARGQEVAVERSDDDHVTLEPHSDIHEERDDEHHGDVPAHLLEPENLRDEHVAAHHDPVRPPVRTEGAIDEGEAFVGTAAVP